MLSYALSASAYISSSTNYRILSDSINVGGLDNSTSTNYKLKDTIGEIATDYSTSTTYSMYAGYRQMEESYVSISISSSVAMSPNVSGITGGIATGAATTTVQTDSSTGYNLKIKASTEPAMKSGSYSFADYTTTSVIPDFNWDIQTANSEFGFSPYNSNGGQADKYKNNGAQCNAGTNVTDTKCWDAFSVTDKEIVNRSGVTTGSGDDTKINFKAEVNSSGGAQPAGAYTATVVVTAVSN